MRNLERWIVGTLMVVALLTFFFPLVTIHLPIVGNQDQSGYDVIADSKNYSHSLNKLTSTTPGGPDSEPTQPAPTSSNAASTNLPMPFSVRTLILIPIEIVVGFICALVALLCCFPPFRSVSAKPVATAGAVSSVVAVLHLTIANSDLHRWFRENVVVGSPDHVADPFAGLAQQIGNLAANAVQLTPGAGLYVCAVALTLATVLLYSRILSAIPSSEPVPTPADPSEHRQAVSAFDWQFGWGLLVVAFFLSIFAIWHFYDAGGSSHLKDLGIRPQSAPKPVNPRPANEVRTLYGHTNNVNSVAFSPDGHTLASGSDDKTIKLWDVASKQLLRTLYGHTHWVHSVAFSPDGHTLASGSTDNTIILWDVASGKLLSILKGHGNGVGSVAFSPDGQTLASGSMDNTVKLWDVASGKVLRTMHGHREDVWSVAFSRNGQTLASGSMDHTIKLWDVASGKLLHTIQGHTDEVNSVAFSPDGRILASGSDDNTIKLWDVASGRLLQTIHNEGDMFLSVAFSPDGRTLASGSYDNNTVRVWNLASGKMLHILQGQKDGLTPVAFSSDGRTVASGCFDNTIRLWDLASEQN